MDLSCLFETTFKRGWGWLEKCGFDKNPVVNFDLHLGIVNIWLNERVNAVFHIQAYG